MSANYKTNSAITLVIWCSSFLSLIVILAWEFGWVSTDVPQAEISKNTIKSTGSGKIKLTDEITKAEEKKFRESNNKKIATEVSDAETEKRLLALASPNSVKPAIKPNKSTTKKTPVPQVKEVAKKGNIETQKPGLLKVSNAKPISSSKIVIDIPEKKPAHKTELISFEKTASVEPATEPLKINPDKESIAIVIPENDDSDNSLNLDDNNLDLEQLTPEQNLPEEIVEIDQLLEKGKYIAAHRKLSSYYWKSSSLREHILPRIEANAFRIYFSPQPHFMKPHVVKSGDHLSQIAKRYNVPWQYLAKLNEIDPKRIQADQKLKVIKGPFSALVNLKEYVISIHAHGYFVCQFPIGIGKDNSTPIGKFAVLNKVANPQYTNPQGTVIEADDPQNPLGEHWIDLGNSYGIHGTIDPDSIGKNESKGCVRMRNEDVEEIYHLLSEGSEVIIRR